MQSDSLRASRGEHIRTATSITADMASATALQTLAVAPHLQDTARMQLAEANPSPTAQANRCMSSCSILPRRCAKRMPLTLAVSSKWTRPPIKSHTVCGFKHTIRWSRWHCCCFEGGALLACASSSAPCSCLLSQALSHRILHLQPSPRA